MMIARIRNSLCNAEPAGVTFLIIMCTVFGLEMYFMGVVEFSFVVMIGVMLIGIVFAFGWLLYKGIVLLQRHCTPTAQQQRDAIRAKHEDRK